VLAIEFQLNSQPKERRERQIVPATSFNLNPPLSYRRREGGGKVYKKKRRLPPARC